MKGKQKMFDNEIMSPNLKLKNFRILIGATQDDVADRVCSKFLISRIENGKKHLSYKLAIGITKNINKVIDMKEIKIDHITAEQLTEDEDSQANNVFSKSIIHALNDIKELCDLEGKLNYGENLIKKYNIKDDMKIEMYKLAATIYYFKEKYTRSDQMCSCGLKICLNSNNIHGEANLYISKSRNDVARKNYEPALEQLNYALKINKDLNNSEISQRIYFNKALIYKKTEKYDKAKKYLKKLTDEFELNDRRKLDIKMLYANCLLDNNELEEAANRFIEIMEPVARINDKGLIAMTYRNVAEVYLKQRKYKDAQISIDKSLEHNPGNWYLAENLYFASLVYKSINGDYESYLLRALEVCEKNKADDTEVTKKTLNDLLEIYMEREDESNIEALIKKEKSLMVDYNKIYAKLVKYYKYRNEEKSNLFNDKLIENL
jgi:tetratricopeptide (TPR) repeat protein